MTKGRSSLWIGGMAMLLAASSAQGQTQGGNNATPVVGSPALQNFQLQPQQQPQPERAQPQPQPQSQQQPQQQRPAPAQVPPPPVQVAPPSPANAPPRVVPAPVPTQRQAAPPATTNRPTPAQRQPQVATPTRQPPPGPSQSLTVPPAVVPSAGQGAQAAPTVAAPPPVSEPAPISIPGEQPPAADAGPGTPVWIATLGAALLALLGLFWLWRRRARRAGEEAEAPPAMASERPVPAPRQATPSAVAPPAPASADRAWLEIELRAERATFNTTEALVQFELDLANAGASAARNVRIDVKLFNAGAEQDKEIGAFFRTAGRESARVTLPGIEAGVNGTIRGEVTISRDEMKALRLDERLLYIPVIAVNVLYDHGDGRTGQTSKSYVVGRELQQPSEKMGAFRVDQGPRVWRTIGQRQHKLARRI